MKRLPVLAVVVCVVLFAGAAQAGAKTYSYIGDLYKWTPRGDASRSKTTKMEVGRLPRCSSAWPATRSRDFASRRLVIGSPKYKKVMRNKFFRFARHRGTLSVTVYWNWKRNSHHTRYKYVTRIDATYQ